MALHPLQDSRHALVVKLGRALHFCGAPAHRLEDVLVAVSKKLKLDGRFVSIPTAFFASFGPGGSEGSHLEPIRRNEIDLTRYCRLDRIVESVLSGSDPEEAAKEINSIENAAPEYGTPLVFLAFLLTAGAAARFFGGGMEEILLAAACGAALGLTHFLVRGHASSRRLLKPLGSAAVAFTAIALAPLGGSANIATLAGLVILVPGFSLTIAMTELATGHLVSGTAKAAYAGLDFLFLGFGVAIGRTVAEGLFGMGAEIEILSLPGWTETAALCVAGVSLGVLFLAPRRELPWVVLAVLLPYWTMRGGESFLGHDLALFAGAFVAGISGNLYSRWRNRPSVVMRLPGILVLVPGVLGFLSFNKIFAGDVVAGIQSFFQVGLTTAALVTGFLAANLLVPPRRIL